MFRLGPIRELFINYLNTNIYLYIFMHGTDLRRLPPVVNMNKLAMLVLMVFAGCLHCVWQFWAKYTLGTKLLFSPIVVLKSIFCLLIFYVVIFYGAIFYITTLFVTIFCVRTLLSVTNFYFIIFCVTIFSVKIFVWHYFFPDYLKTK